MRNSINATATKPEETALDNAEDDKGIVLSRMQLTKTR